MARNSSSIERYVAIARGNCSRPDTGTTVLSTARRSLLNPMSTCASASRLRPSSAAPITSATASAISVTTNAFRAQPPRAPSAEPLPPWRSPSARSTRETCHAGARPKTRLAANEIASANNNVAGSTVTSVSRGRSAGASATSALTPQRAMITPPVPASSASTTLSVSICRIRRRRPAPTAARTTSSRPRAAARASSRLATLAQAISNTNATAASSTNNVCRVSPTTTSCSGTAAMPLSALLSGYCCARRDAMADISDCACAGDTPGASLPTPR